jgi:hypothetical protein
MDLNPKNRLGRLSGRRRIGEVREQLRGQQRGAHFEDRFIYGEAADSYHCPEGQLLPFRSMARANGKTPILLYRVSGKAP